MAQRPAYDGQPRLEGELAGDVPGGRERLLDGGEQVLRAAVEMFGGFAPFIHGLVTEAGVVGNELEGGVAELVPEFVEDCDQVAEAGVGDEAGDAAEPYEDWIVETTGIPEPGGVTLLLLGLLPLLLSRFRRG